MTKAELLQQLEHVNDMDDVYVLVHTSIEPDSGRMKMLVEFKEMYNKCHITRVTTDQFRATLHIETIKI